MLKGIPASPGIVSGKILVLKHEHAIVEKNSREDSNFEISRLEKAITEAQKDLELLIAKTAQDLGQDKGQIFEAHLMLLNDPALFEETTALIKNEKVNCEWAFKMITQKFIEIFESMEDEYMRERSLDVKDVSGRVINILLGVKSVNLALIVDPVILVAHDLTPSETATLNRKAVLGFLTNIGGKTSHAAIMARSMELPAIVGLKNITTLVENNMEVLFDGHSGEVILNPSREVIEEYSLRKTSEEKVKKELSIFKDKKTMTSDGHQIHLAGNIGSINDLESLINNSAEAVGLFRTEFLFMDRSTMPSEEEQFLYYKKIVQGFKHSIIIRTLDIGGDKKLDYLPIPPEMNPFLGYRAIRLCLDDQELFKIQLRAILRASCFGEVKIMFPMISCMDELLMAKKILEEVKKDLDQKNILYDSKIKVGMMIEVPAAAMIADLFAKEVDFFSIGTNDLTQYSCAVDRMNEKIAHLYNPFHPGLLRLIAFTIKSARKAKIEVGICGSMAHQEELVPFFIGMGVTELSMSPMHILKTRQQISTLNYKKCCESVENILNVFA